MCINNIELYCCLVNSFLLTLLVTTLVCLVIQTYRAQNKKPCSPSSVPVTENLHQKHSSTLEQMQSRGTQSEDNEPLSKDANQAVNRSLCRRDKPALPSPSKRPMNSIPTCDLPSINKTTFHSAHGPKTCKIRPIAQPNRYSLPINQYAGIQYPWEPKQPESCASGTWKPTRPPPPKQRCKSMTSLSKSLGEALDQILIRGPLTLKPCNSSGIKGDSRCVSTERLKDPLKQRLTKPISSNSIQKAGSSEQRLSTMLRTSPIEKLVSTSCIKHSNSPQIPPKNENVRDIARRVQESRRASVNFAIPVGNISGNWQYNMADRRQQMAHTYMSSAI